MGLSNHEKIILHLDLIDTDAELSAVFLHEMGHIVDLGYLTGNSYYGRTTFKDRSNQSIETILVQNFMRFLGEPAILKKVMLPEKISFLDMP